MNLLIDGSNLLHRVHWVPSTKFFTEDGTDITNVYLFLNTIKSYAKTFNTKDIYIAWDKKILWPSKNFRTEHVEYKAHRDKEKNKDVYNNEELLIDMLQTLGIKNIYPRIMEADDVISWLSRRLQGPNVIITVDGDMLQLIDENTTYYHGFKRKVIDLNNFEKEVGIKKQYFLTYKAILGDKSDNIEGLKGYGEVKAKKLAELFLSNFVNQMPMLKEEQLQIIEKNLKLMNLENGYIKAGPEEVQSYQEQMIELSDLEPNMNKFKEHCRTLRFQSFLNNFKEWEDIFTKFDLFSIINQISHK